MDTLLKEKTANLFINFADFQNISNSNPCTQLMEIHENRAVAEEKVKFCNDSEKALYLLQSHGYLPKVFCIPAPQEEISTVKSNCWDWNIAMVKNHEQLKQVPVEFINGIQLLLHNNIKIDGVAIARPKMKENPKEVIKQEFNYSMKMAAKMVGFLILGIVAVIGSFGNAVSSAGLVEGADPVLLIKTENNWLEIGRWE